MPNGFICSWKVQHGSIYIPSNFILAQILWTPSVVCAR